MLVLGPSGAHTRRTERKELVPFRGYLGSFFPPCLLASAQLCSLRRTILACEISVRKKQNKKKNNNQIFVRVFEPAMRSFACLERGLIPPLFPELGLSLAFLGDKATFSLAGVLS